MNLRTAFVAAVAAVAGMTTSVAAQTYNGMTVQELRSVFENAGISFQVLESDYFRVGGVANAWLTNCRSGKCYELRYSSTFSDVQPTLGAVNRWNWEKRVPEASITDDGVLHMEMWMTLKGASSTSIITTLDWFAATKARTDFWQPYMSGS